MEREIAKGAIRYLENPMTGEINIYDPETNTYKPTNPSDLRLDITPAVGLKSISGEEFKDSEIFIDCKAATFTVNGLEIRIDTSKFPKWLGNTEYIKINGIRFNREKKEK